MSDRFTSYRNADRFASRVRQLQRTWGITEDGIIGNQFLTAAEKMTGVVAPETIDQTDGIKISNAAQKLIVKFETGNRDYYNKRLTRPAWPGYSSGVTIGFGYDLGYHTAGQIRKDWRDQLPAEHIESLVRVAGVTGRDASRVRSKVSHIEVPWEVAQKVFNEVTLPRYAALAVKTFPGMELLRPHAQGALVSLIFNRGSKLSGDRRREMKAIKKMVALQDYAGIANEIRKMKRLWKRVNGKSDLHGRRDAEADMVMNRELTTGVISV